MKITELKIGDKVCLKTTKQPMIVVGLFSTLKDIAKDLGSVYLDFEGNVGDMLEEDIKDLEVYEK